MAAPGCRPESRCKGRGCDHCGPIRARDEYIRFRANIDEFGGRVLVFAVTPPGKDVLPWETVGPLEVVSPRPVVYVNGYVVDAGTGEVVPSDEWLGYERRPTPPRRVVDGEYATRWNETASVRYARLFKAAQKSADDLLRRHGVAAQRQPFPRRVANVWSPQGRGLWHIHEALPAETAMEQLWARQVVRFMDQVRKREFRMTGGERWTLLELERCFGIVTRGFYGFGFVDRNPLRKMSGASYDNERATRYLAKNASEYLAKNSAEVGLVGRKLRSYVSRRLTAVTGATLRNMQRKRYLYVCLTRGLPLPNWDRELLEKIWGMIESDIGSGIAIRGP